MNGFQGKIVWITGASSGIGEALAIAMAGKGARVIISARNMEKLHAVKEQCASMPVQILPIDLENTDNISEVVDAAFNIYGGIDVLINNAGVSQRSLASETKFEVYRKIMEVNYFGTIALTQEVLKYFHRQNGGTIATLSSVAGITGLPYRTAYCSSKFALEGFFASLRTELWRTNIKILMIRPGAVRTNIAEHALTGDCSQFTGSDHIIDNGMDPAFVAEKIIDAIASEKKLLMLGSFRERSLFVLNRFFPKLVFNAVKKIKH